ncbi:hypothetical protein Lser_V15G32867 [Lactuca serriola]
MASTSSNPQEPHVALEVGEEEYPYPYSSRVCASNLTSVKLSGKAKFVMWKTQMLCLLESHGMSGFIDGTLVSPQTSVSGKEKVGDHQTRHKQWRRSDALVKGWILSSLSEETLGYVLKRLSEKLHHQERNASDFSAKDVWDELQTIYGPAVLPQLLVSDKPQDIREAWSDDQYLILKEQEDKRRKSALQKLYQAAISRDWDSVHAVFKRENITVIDKMTNNGNTPLHIAVGATKKADLLQKLLERTPENTRLLDLTNSDGCTLLHVAAIVGNTEAADILVGRNRELLLAKDNEGHTPLAIALSNMHTQTSKQLLQYINTDIEKDALFSGTSGEELLVVVISSKDFGLAHDMMLHYKRGPLDSDAVPMAIAQNFPCRSILEEYKRAIDIMHGRVEAVFQKAFYSVYNRCSFLVGIVWWLFLFGFYGIIILFPLIIKLLVSPFIKERVRIRKEAINLLENVCHSIKLFKDSSNYHHYYTNPIFEATRQNAYEFVEYIVSNFPDAIWCTNEDGHNIIQYAVINRSEKVYNLLYQMSVHKNVYRTIKDSHGNNLLHLAARLAPNDKLNHVSGAALQIQRELQWFKEVERFVCPLNIIQKNSFDETPQLVFTREHKDLVIDGEKWMKATAESYTITAALITTIVFAAAITVPGGNKDTGIPVFTNNNAFKIFAISVAISLFTSATSLLMFLSILTARFAEQDFLFMLPTKLIIGLATLFISTTAMISAFSATLYLVFGQSNARILIPIVVLTCLPITSFVTLQFPLVIDLMSATYGRSIFRKQNDSIFY